MYYPNYIGKDWIDPISGRPVNPMANQHQTPAPTAPAPKEATIMELLEQNWQKQQEKERPQSMLPENSAGSYGNSGAMANIFGTGTSLGTIPSTSSLATVAAPTSESINNGVQYPISTNCEMVFDGKNLNLFNNGQLIDVIPAMAGQADYHSKKFQSQPDGPIPEGNWYTTQDDRQFIDPVNAILGEIKYNGTKLGNWKGV